MSEFDKWVVKELRVLKAAEVMAKLEFERAMADILLNPMTYWWNAVGHQRYGRPNA